MKIIRTIVISGLLLGGLAACAGAPDAPVISVTVSPAQNLFAPGPVEGTAGPAGTDTYVPPDQRPVFQIPGQPRIYPSPGSGGTATP